jgi:AAA domain-containing protein
MLRIAVSGAHGTGKSTLIAAFLERFPDYHHEPEAYESLADDVDLISGEVPSPEGLQLLLDHTITAVGSHPPGARVIFERSPADYLAYAAASRGYWPRETIAAFVEEALPRVREAMKSLDRLALLPVVSQGPIRGRGGEDPRYRRRVSRALERLLLDDEYRLFEGTGPRVIELSGDPERWLGRLAETVRKE